MPSPIAHSVTGYALSQPFVRPRQRLLLFTSVFLTNAADLDFAAQFLGIGTHRGITHTIPFLVGLTLVIGAIAHRLGHRSVRLLMGLTLLLYGSHLLLDFYTAGDAGLRLWLPFSDRPFQAATPLFPSVQHTKGLFYAGHWQFISFELAYSGAMLGALWGWRILRRSPLLRSLRTMAQPQNPKSETRR
ncbi:MAG: metal-dependent hydrolase [Elainellaceae cyanobacterium]